MSESDPHPYTDPHPHTDPKATPEHDLTPLETYFDALFNQHMVLPLPPEEAPVLDTPSPQTAEGANTP